MTKRFCIVSILLLAALFGLALIASIGDVPAKAGSAVRLAEPLWGPDIQVNPAAIETPSAHRNLSMAINPADPNIVLAGYGSIISSYSSSGYSRSTNGGRAWSGSSFTQTWSGGPEPMLPAGDVHVGFDARGTGYYTSQALGNNANGYFVLTTTNGSTWGTPMPIIILGYDESHSMSGFAVDPRVSGPNAGSLYMGWLATDNISPYIRGVRMRYSRDGGRTWSGDSQVSNDGHEYTYGPAIEVASNGVVYAAFEELFNYYHANSPRLYLNRSIDGGVSWGTDRLIGGGPVVPIGIPDFKGRELTLLGDSFCSLIHIQHFPSMAVSPGDPNTIYVVWNDGRWEPPVSICALSGRHSDIAFSRSTDGGVNWSTPMRINDDPIANGVDQFQPTIAVRADGVIGATWIDRRYSGDGYLYDLAYSQSTDGGLTWSANARVSDVSSNSDHIQDFKGINDLGYRRPLVFGPDYVLPGWIDTHLGTLQGDFFTDHGTLPAITLTPTPVVPTTTPTTTPTPGQPTDTPTHQPTITPTATSCPMNFSDVSPSDWFYPYVRYLYCRGVISGYGSTFHPNDNTSRGQICKIIVLADNFPINTSGGPHFTDVPVGSTFYPYVETAFNRGIIVGYGDTFRPNNNTTRAQLCKIVVLARSWPINTSGGPHFTDVLPTDTLYPFIETAFNKGIITGYGSTFRLNNSATRAQLSKIVYLAITTP